MINCLTNVSDSHYSAAPLHSLNVCGPCTKKCTEDAASLFNDVGVQVKTHTEVINQIPMKVHHFSDKMVRYKAIIQQAISSARKLAQNEHMQIVLTAEKLDEISQKAGPEFLALLAAEFPPPDEALNHEQRQTMVS